MKKKQFVFFLGGNDVEMRRISEVVCKAGYEIYDAKLSWGAKASTYKDQLREIEELSRIPVLVELEVDYDLPESVVVVDHHGERSGEPPALIQILDLLGIEPSREDVLIGAMDAGFVFGLQAIGATKDEIARFLGLDFIDNMSIRDMLLRTESGFESEIIAESERAVAERECVGDMIIVRCAHSKTAPINVRLIGEQDEQNILILSDDGEVNYYGMGEIVQEIIKKFPGGWSGGAGLMPHTPEAKSFWEQWGGHAPDTAFWGGYPDHEKILDFLSKKFSR